MEVSTARRLERSEVGGAATVLARAFFDDPVSTFAWPDAGKRVARSERAFGTQLRVLGDRREVHVDASFSSVAVFARPDEWVVPIATTLRMLPGYLRSAVRLRALVAYTKTDRLHPDEPHWYLEYLGTDPQRQGRGLGAQVLASLLARADADGLSVWAWSSNRRNLAFYHRHGFLVLDELPLGKGGPTIFPIRREPRG